MTAEQAEEFGLSPEEITDIDRLRRLKAERDALDSEIKYLTEWTRKTVHGYADWEVDGVTYVVSVSAPPKSESVDIDRLQELHPELALHITRTQVVVDPEKLAEAKRLGFFAEGTKAHDALVITEGTPRVSINPKKNTQKETSSE